jgi:hypothetical protein
MPIDVVVELRPQRIHVVNPCGYTSGESKISFARYRRTNWASSTASLRKRGSLLIWLDNGMTWLAPLDGTPEHQPERPQITPPSVVKTQA